MLTKEALRYIALFNIITAATWVLILTKFFAVIFVYPELEFSKAYVICVMAYLYILKIGREMINSAILDGVFDDNSR